MASVVISEEVRAKVQRALSDHSSKVATLTRILYGELDLPAKLVEMNKRIKFLEGIGAPVRTAKAFEVEKWERDILFELYVELGMSS